MLTFCVHLVVSVTDLPLIRLHNALDGETVPGCCVSDQESLLENGSSVKKKPSVTATPTAIQKSAAESFLEDLMLFKKPISNQNASLSLQTETPKVGTKRSMGGVRSATPGSVNNKKQRTMVNVNSPAVSRTPRIKRVQAQKELRLLLDGVAEEYRSSGDGGRYVLVSASSGNMILSAECLNSLVELLPMLDDKMYDANDKENDDVLKFVLKMALSRLDESCLTLKQVCTSSSDEADLPLKFSDSLKQSQEVLQNVYISLLVLLYLSKRAGDETAATLSSHHVGSLLQSARDIVSDTVMYCMSMPCSQNDERSVQNSFMRFLDQGGEWKSCLIDIVQVSVSVLEALHEILESSICNLFVTDEALLSLCFMNVNIVIGEFSAYDKSSGDDEDDDTPKVYPSSFIGYMYGQMQFHGGQILQWIYARFQQHRIFLIDEILSNVTKMPSLQAAVSTHKRKATASSDNVALSNAWGTLYDSSNRNGKSSHSLYSLKDGKVINVCSAVFLQFAQSIAEYEMRQWLLMPRSNEETDTDSALDELIESILNSITQMATYIFNYLLKRSFVVKSAAAVEDKLGSTETIPFTNEYRIALEGFLTDLLNVLGYVEFPAAFVFVQVVSYTLTEFVDNRGFASGETDTVKQPPANLSSCLEYLTVIFSKILDLQKKVPINKKEDDIFAVESDPVQSLGSILDYLDGTQSKALENRSSKSLHIVLCKKSRSTNGLTLTKIQDLLSAKTRLDVSDRQHVETSFVETISKEHLFSTAAINNLTARLVQYLDDNNIALRIRSLRSIVALMKSGAKVMEISKVQTAACARLLDGSASVRELAVELLFSVIKCGDRSFLFDFYHLLSGRILDTAVAVRKKTIRCLRELYLDLQLDTESNILKFKIDICRKIMNRFMFDNENSVKDLAAKSIDDIWFTVPKATSLSISDLPCSKSLTSMNVVAFSQQIGLQNYQDERYEEMERFLEPNVEVMSAVMAEVGSNLLKNIIDKTNVKSFWSSIASLQLYVDYLINSPTISALSWNLLSRFCECAPVCFIRHSESVITYLQRMNPHDESTFDKQCLISILRIFATTIEMMEYDPPSVLKWGNEIVDSNTVRDILPKIADMAGKQASTITESCIHSLNLVESKLDIHGTEGSFLQQMMTKCLKYSIIQSQLNADKIAANSLIRALFILGLIFKNDNSLSRAESLIQQAHGVFIHFAQLPCSFDGVKRTAVTALGCVWTKFPLLLLETKSLEIVDMFLNSSDTQDDNVKIQMLNVISNFILEDEIKTLTTPSKNGCIVKDSKTLTGESQQHTESSICSSLMQRYLSPILDSLVSLNAEMRHSASEVISATIRNGLIHPLQSVPYLIVLESVESGKMKDKVIALHEDLCNKYISFIHNKNMDGIRMVHDFRQKTAKIGEDEETGIEWSSCLQSLYRLVRQKKQHRRTFLKQIIQTFLDPAVVKVDGLSSSSIALFVAENIARFEFKLLEEPLLLLQSLGKIISTAGLETSHLFEKDDEIATSDRQKLGGDAKLTIVCMQLKMHLQSLYGISDQRCQSFDANESSRMGEKPVHLREANPLNLSAYTFNDNIADANVWKQFVEMYHACVAALESFSLSIDYYNDGQGASSNAATPTTTQRNPKKQDGDQQYQSTPASRKSNSKKKKRQDKTPTTADTSRRQSMRGDGKPETVNYAESSDSDFE